MYVVLDAVIDRLKADTTLYTGGAWQTSIVRDVSTIFGNPTSGARPRAVVSASWTADHGHGAMYGRCDITLTYFYDDSMTNGGRAWVDRVIGDAMLSSGTNYTPTYGLHNHVLSLPSIGTDNVLGMTCDQLNYESLEMGASDSPDTRYVTLGFSCRVFKKATNA